MPFKIRLLLVDDHRIFTEALTSLLLTDATFAVVGVAHSLDVALELAESVAPDVVLLDLSLGNVSGLTLIPKLTNTRLCVVSMHAEPHLVLQAFRFGALGYVCKASAGAELIQGVHAVSRGETFLCSLAKKATFSVGGLLTRSEKGPLTERESAVLAMAGQGRTAAEIAEQLRISRRTAEAHRANGMKKLALKSQTDLVLYTVRSGMVAV